MLTRRTLSASGAGLVVVVAVAAVAVTDPFAGSAPAASGSLDNGAPTSLVTVVRRSLTSQAQVDGTLGYADPQTISLTLGSSPASVRQAEQALAAARQTLDSATSAQASDLQALDAAQARLRADRLKEQGDCAGAGAAERGGGTASGQGSSGAAPCVSAAQAVAADEIAATAAEQKAAADAGQVASATGAVNSADQSLAAARSGAGSYDPGAVYTMLPQAGSVIARGEPLYGIDGTPTILLYGTTAAWRAFAAGMTPGADVAQLNRNLAALGYGSGLEGPSFTSGTEAAVKALQAARGLAVTGQLPLGSVSFAGGPVRVTSVTPSLGQAAQAGPVLAVTSTRHEVAVQLDAAQQSQIAVGDAVVVTLPDNSTTPAVVSKVGKVATTPSSDQGNGGSSSPTIEVDIKLLHQAAAGSLDQAPVSVSITTGSVHDALVVPVNALLALAGGGYAVEVSGAGGSRRLVAVELGLFDDAEGLVQVRGSGVQAGQRIVVPAE